MSGARAMLKTTIANCPRCGAPIVPPGITLPPIKRRIFEAVRRHPGIGAEELRSLVWASDPNGGPEDRKVLHVHVHQLNRRLAAHGLRVWAGQGAGRGYRLEACHG